MATNKMKTKAVTKTASVSATPFINPLSGILSNAVSGAANTVPDVIRQQPATPAQDAYNNRGTPYTDLANAYAEKAREMYQQQQEAMAKQLDASKQSTSSNYDSAAAGNYVNYMKQQNALGEQLAQQGIRGGASESALARIGNNYAMNQGNTAAQRYGALAQLQSAYDNNLANMRQAMEERIADNDLALRQSQIQYDDTLAQRAAEEARYNAEVQRAARERAEDIARDEEWKQKEFDFTKEQYKKDQEWKQKEWTKLLRDQKLEQYAAGTEQYVTTSDISKIDKQIKKIKKDKNWAKDRTKYGQVKALQARKGWIKQYNDNK